MRPPTRWILLVLTSALLACAAGAITYHYRWRTLKHAPILNKVYDIRFHAKKTERGAVELRWRTLTQKPANIDGLFYDVRVYGLDEVPPELTQDCIEDQLGRLCEDRAYYYDDAVGSDPLVYLRLESERLVGYLGYTRWRPGLLCCKPFYFFVYMVENSTWDAILHDKFVIDYIEASTCPALTRLEVVEFERSIHIKGIYNYYLLTDGNELGHYAQLRMDCAKYPGIEGYWLVALESQTRESGGNTSPGLGESAPAPTEALR